MEERPTTPGGTAGAPREPYLFVCYRREDSRPAVARLRSDLGRIVDLTRVFVDETTIRPGATWPDEIRAALERATCVIVVIGVDWLHLREGASGQRLLDQEDDWVRQEIEVALARGVAVVPLLVEGAAMPEREQLPRSIRSLVDRNALQHDPESCTELVRLLKERGLARPGAGVLNRALEVLVEASNARGYDAAHDVRDARVAGPFEPGHLTLIAGDIGVGKSWTSIAIALALLRQWRLTIHVEASRDASRVRDDIGRMLWTRVLRRDGAVPGFAAICRELDELELPCVVIVDGVDAQDVGNELATMDRHAGRFHLVFACSVDVAESVHARHRDRCRIERIDRFTPSQLQRYFELRHTDWTRVPQDVRGFLALPILARIYADVADPKGWAPRNEYEIFRRFWHDRLENAPGADPRDVVTLRALARDVVDGGEYPWAADRVDPATVDRLHRRGWLRQDVDGRVFAVHYRLLSWAAAEALAAEVRDGLLDAASLVAILSRTKERRLTSDVAPDVLWLLRDRVELVASVVLGVEWKLAAGLCTGILPTLGDLAGPVFERLLERHAEPEGGFRLAHVVQGWLASGDPKLAQHGVRLIASEDPELRLAGASLLVEHPSRSAADRLWELLSDADERETYEVADLSAALRSCSDAEWLVGAILATPSGDPRIVRLAWVLASMRAGTAVWPRVRDHVLAGTTGELPYPIGSCILRYGDASDVPWLRAHAVGDHGELVDSVMAALAKLQPEFALAAIADPTTGIWNTWWIDSIPLAMRMLRMQSRAARATLMAHLRTEYDDGIACALEDDPAFGPEIAELRWQRLAAHQLDWGWKFWPAKLGTVRDPSLVDDLERASFGLTQTLWGSVDRVAAIRGLAAFRPRLAVEAAMTMLHETGDRRHAEFAQLVVEIDPDRAAGLLLQHVRDVTSLGAVHGIAEALAELDCERGALALLLDDAAPVRRIGFVLLMCRRLSADAAERTRQAWLDLERSHELHAFDGLQSRIRIADELVSALDRTSDRAQRWRMGRMIEQVCCEPRRATPIPIAIVRAARAGAAARARSRLDQSPRTIPDEHLLAAGLTRRAGPHHFRVLPCSTKPSLRERTRAESTSEQRSRRRGMPRRGHAPEQTGRTQIFIDLRSVDAEPTARLAPDRPLRRRGSPRRSNTGAPCRHSSSGPTRIARAWRNILPHPHTQLRDRAVQQHSHRTFAAAEFCRDQVGKALLRVDVGVALHRGR